MAEAREGKVGFPFFIFKVKSAGTVGLSIEQVETKLHVGGIVSLVAGHRFLFVS
jgi:hypothetical protein